jgi:hypothetical protein
MMGGNSSRFQSLRLRLRSLIVTVTVTVIILATYHKGKCTTNANPLSPIIPAQTHGHGHGHGIFILATHLVGK